MDILMEVGSAVLFDLFLIFSVTSEISSMYSSDTRDQGFRKAIENSVLSVPVHSIPVRRVIQCADLCLKQSACRGFQYGTSHVDGRPTKVCQLLTEDDLSSNGAVHCSGMSVYCSKDRHPSIATCTNAKTPSMADTSTRTSVSGTPTVKAATVDTPTPITTETEATTTLTTISVEATTRVTASTAKTKTAVAITTPAATQTTTSGAATTPAAATVTSTTNTKTTATTTDATTVATTDTTTTQLSTTATTEITTTANTKPTTATERTTPATTTETTQQATTVAAETTTMAATTAPTIAATLTRTATSPTSEVATTNTLTTEPSTSTSESTMETTEPTPTPSCVIDGAVCSQSSIWLFYGSRQLTYRSDSDILNGEPDNQTISHYYPGWVGTVDAAYTDSTNTHIHLIRGNRVYIYAVDGGSYVREESTSEHFGGDVPDDIDAVVAASDTSYIISNDVEYHTRPGKKNSVSVSNFFRLGGSSSFYPSGITAACKISDDQYLFFTGGVMYIFDTRASGGRKEQWSLRGNVDCN